METIKISNEEVKENLFLRLDELRKEVSRVSSSQTARDISNPTRDDLDDWKKQCDYTIKLSFIQRDKIAENLDEVGDSRLSYDVLRYVIERLYDNDVKDLHFDFAKLYKSFKDEYCDLFNDLTTDLNIKTIYVLTPKSKYYHLDLAKYEYDSIWYNILDSLESRNIEVWNYEKMNTDTFKINWFWDDTHSTYDGAKAFTKVIKKRLRD